MAEYKLSYTAKEIDEKLGKVDEHETSIAQLSEDIEKIVDDKNFDELKMLVEANIINIVSDNNNTILADNDGKIYVL